MAAHDDIAASLPQPPPPAPARRAAAIEAALRRFDGVDEPATASAESRPAQSGWWTRLSRPQIGALVSAAIVALIGVPAAWLSFSQFSGADRQPGPRRSVEDSSAAVDSVAADQSIEMPARSAGETAAVAPKASSQLGQAPAPAPPPGVQARSGAAAPPAPMEFARAEAQKPSAPAAAGNDIVVTAGRREEKRMDVPMSVTAVGEEAPGRQREAEQLADADEDNIIVTAARRKAATDRRGDWNACTINDPSRSLRSCGRLVNPNAKGPAGRAGAHLAEGLSRAWEGDLDDAIAAFDQAIAATPRNGFAYLNRGLAHQRNGDPDRALADLNLAIRYAPNARAYFNRAQLLREKGDAKRARQDEDRAVEFDRRYADVVE